MTAYSQTNRVVSTLDEKTAAHPSQKLGFYVFIILHEGMAKYYVSNGVRRH